MQDKKTFRLFISSTFRDFGVERKVLQTDVFPEIRKYCNKRSLSFQPIDLRWGVSNEAQLDQKTLELCLNEVRSCKQHPSPNFLVMLGDRYGWVTLPYLIEQSEFENLIPHIPQKDLALVSTWYQLDKNQIPAAFLLQERAGDYVDYDTWQTEEAQLRTILQKALRAADLNPVQKLKYFQSATEAEIMEGIIPFLEHTPFQQKLLQKQPGLADLDATHVFGFFRTIDRIALIVSDFFEDDQDYQKAQQLKDQVKGILTHKLDIHTQPVTQNQINTDYLTDFSQAVMEFLKARIDEQLKEQTSLSDLDAEIAAHQAYAQQKKQNFIGQKIILNQISRYCQDKCTQPLVIYGTSGSGKSALMAQAEHILQEQTHNPQAPQQTPTVIQRFVGATPNASNLKTLLYFIFAQLGIDARSETEKQTEASENKNLQLNANDAETFEQLSYRMYEQLMGLANLTHSIILFIDAIDQVDHEDQFLWLPKNLPSNLKIIISVLDDDNYPEDSKYFTSLKTKTDALILVEDFNDKDAKELLKQLLKADSRSLQAHQWEYFFQQYQTSPSPLYIQLAAQEVKHWKSTDRVAELSIPSQPNHLKGQKTQDLAKTQQGIIQEFIKNLSKLYHHDALFIERVLSYIHISQDGLSESELIQLINQDTDFINQIAPDKFHQKEFPEIPTVIWSRLLLQLRPFLSQHQQDGENLLSFFHREFASVIKQNPNIKAQHLAIIEASQKLITQVQDLPFHANRWGKLYNTLVTQYDLQYKEESLQEGFAKFITSLKNPIYVKQFLEEATSNAEINEDKNKLFISKSEFSFLFFSLSQLSKNNESEWSDFFIKILNGYSYVLYRQNQVSSADKIIEKSIDLCEKYHDEKRVVWAKNYTWALTLRMYVFKSSPHFEEESWSEEHIQSEYSQVFEMVKKWLESSPDEWTEDFVIAALNYAPSLPYHEYQQTADIVIDIFNEVIECLHGDKKIKSFFKVKYFGEILEILEPVEAFCGSSEQITITKTNCINAIQKNANNIVEDIQSPIYEKATAYKAISLIDKGRGQYDKAAEFTENALNIFETLYKIDPVQWGNQYLDTISEIIKLYEPNQQNEKLIGLYDLLLDVSKTLFRLNPEQWCQNMLSTLESNISFYKGLSHSDKNKNTTVKDYSEQYLDLVRRCSLQNDVYEQKYYLAIDSLSRIYEDEGDLNSAIKLLIEKSDKLKSNYTKNPGPYAQNYSDNLGEISRLFYKIKDYKSTLIYKKLQCEIQEEIYEKCKLYKPKYNIGMSIETNDSDNLERCLYQHTLFMKEMASFFIDCGEYQNAQKKLEESLKNIKKIKKISSHPGFYDDDIKDVINKLESIGRLNMP